MKNWVGIFLGTISLLILVGVMIMAFLMVHRPDQVAPINKIFAKTPQLHPVIVVDFDKNGSIDQAELLRGKDGIIAIMRPDKGGQVKDDLFNSVSALKKLDANKDNMIDAHDPLYPYLQLMFFTDGGKGSRYVSLAQAGIQSIKLEQQRLSDKAIADLNVQNNRIGEAIMTNGEQHDLRMMAIAVP